MHVYVTYDFAQPHLLCPECGQAGPYYDLREERTWRHLDSCQFQTFLVARLLRLSPTQVQEIMVRAVARGLARRDQQRHLPHLSLEEKSFQQGHHYITVLGASLGKGVLDVVEGCTLEAAKSLLLSSLSLSQREQVASVSMDMWPAFAGAKEQVLPKAQTVHDRFHIAGYLTPIKPQ